VNTPSCAGVAAELAESLVLKVNAAGTHRQKMMPEHLIANAGHSLVRRLSSAWIVVSGFLDRTALAFGMQLALRMLMSAEKYGVCIVNEFCHA
jgi:hypothetical protein